MLKHLEKKIISQLQPYKIELNNVNLVLNTLDSSDETQEKQVQHAIVPSSCSNFYKWSNCAGELIIDQYFSKFHDCYSLKYNQVNQIQKKNDLEQFTKLYLYKF
ncbi:unnamed protein product [Paramecium octaurelia]|uniref:Uncharacterized protein n=1 Tax=Paramecium octaurelia TaxID=43137 RepID=A0A8S1YGP2_PAROT|nr:unnamed protein product [Paramecium octaurelia]